MSYQAIKYIVYGLDPIVPMEVVDEEPNEETVFVPLNTEWSTNNVVMFIITDLGIAGADNSTPKFINEVRIDQEVVGEQKALAANPGEHPDVFNFVVATSINDLMSRLSKRTPIRENGIPIHTQDKLSDGHIIQVAAVPLN
ncbi:hypothetical protein [Weissella minor]|uniref:hypothetical protein n=1 Tax=Weissella minor TaxID=1620 RepID=UPI003AF2E8F1